MALGELEQVWRAWQALNMHDRARSCTCFVKRTGGSERKGWLPIGAQPVSR